MSGLGAKPDLQRPLPLFSKVTSFPPMLMFCDYFLGWGRGACYCTKLQEVQIKGFPAETEASGRLAGGGTFGQASLKGVAICRDECSVPTFSRRKPRIRGAFPTEGTAQAKERWGLLCAARTLCTEEQSGNQNRGHRRTQGKREWRW